jgi:glycosyltransferase involved in cell wall biosynthesis
MTAARLCLNMIVRNEAPIIRRALESVADHIACWAIVDTGSTDETKAIIAEFFAARGIPGGFLDHAFDGFDRSRNRALDFARQSPEAFDYLLLMDADMQLRVGEPAFRESLAASAYQVRQKAGISYWNTRLLRRDAPSVYRGVTHEYLDHAGDVDRLEGIWFDDEADGANRAGKFERDIGLLLGGLEAEPDNARYVYYLAQSYRDAGQHEKAAETYERRFAMGGWEEERWSALLNAARSRLALGDDAGFLATASRALEFRPGRAEPLHDIAVYYRTRGRYEEAMMFLELASHIPYPAGDRLFVEDFVYQAGIRQEMSIAGFYCRSPERRAIGRLACNALALDRDAPPDVRRKARENLVYYARNAAELMPSWGSWRLPWSPPCYGQPMNPSIAMTADGWRMVVRVVNYRTVDAVDFVVPEGEPYRTRNFLLRLDDDLRPLAAQEILPPPDWPAPRFGEVLGLEDMRLFVWCGALWGSATTRELADRGKCQIVLGRIDAEAAGDTRLAGWRVVSVGGPPRHEKNWMPRINGDRLEFIYTCDPTRLIDSEGCTVSEAATGVALDQLRGGSQAIPFDDGWLALTHEVSFIEGGRVYLHRFVWYDGQMRLRQFSEAFTLNGRGVEFAAGLAWHPDGERLVVSYGVSDAEAWLATVSAADVRRAIQ